jgi:hypothetical protein
VEEGKPFLGNQKDQNDGAEQPKKGNFSEIIHKEGESDKGSLHIVASFILFHDMLDYST